MGDGLYERIYEVAKRIPRGRVATYGQIAALVGMPKAARQVGYAMAALGRGAPRPLASPSRTCRPSSTNPLSSQRW